MEEPLESELLARYLASDASAAERASVEAWVAASPANAAELDRLRRAWSAKHERSWDIDAAWGRVQSKLDVAPPVASRPSRHPRGQWLVLRIAAAVVLVAGITLVWRERRPEPPAPPVVYATAVGERQTIELRDGTRVMLGPSSELRVDASYDRAGRRVDLSGEAWFEVHHDASQAFRVYAAGTVTEDLGTSFSVRAIPSDSIVHVVLVEGAAAVGLERAPVASRSTLRPREVADINITTEQINVRRNVDVESLVSWRAGRVEFNDTPLSDVGAELQRWYGVATQFASPALATRPVSYSMPTNDLPEAVDVLSRLLGVTIERRGDTLFIR